ncbi:plant UBX domain-containing protein 9-like isoform X1 [Senna tora]|uniref:Plant UBX domain-containing protein 9-like isoform X1 n=1 Tax=Senna tora TaxID=362788 RepID=A0A834XHZ1_9FABA|nr:plant UBX domain-containing protein 9-like isoform X1 [Senna tora]
MATPTPDAIEAFMRITGSSEFVAVRKLEEYGGNLNEAVNAHFIEGNRHIVRQNFGSASQYNHMDVNNQNHVESRGLLPLLSAARRFRPSLLLDPNYRRELRDLCNGIGTTAFTGRVPYDSHPGEVREVPVAMNSMFEQPHHSGLRSTSVDMSGNSLSHGRGNYGLDDLRSDFNLTQPNTSHIPNNATEEEMIQAAIEASRLESRESASGRQFGAFNDSFDGSLPPISSHQEDEDLARAISLSLKMAEEEEAMHKHLADVENEELGVRNLLAMRENANNSRWQPGTSSNRGTAQDLTPVIGAPLNHSAGSHLQGTEDVLISEEWGNMSSEELNEAVLLETALFGDTSNPTSHNLSSFPDLQQRPERNVEREVQCLPTPTTQSLTATQLLIKQQDVDYLASLLADKQKELNALKEVETQRLKEKESCNIVERKEWEKMLDRKENFIPKEPPLDDENAVTIIVRMPDGSRRGRRFLKTDKLKFIFDFIDIDGTLKTGSYRVVKSYPRRAYSIDDSSLALSEVGLTNKHEALFLELI